MKIAKLLLSVSLGAATLLALPLARAAAPSISISTPATVNTNEVFDVTVTGTDVDGDLNSMGLRWQGVGLVGWWLISGGWVQRIATLTAPGTTQTLNLRGEVWDNASNGTTGAWVQVPVLQNTTPLVSLTGPTSLTVGQSGTWNFSTWESANPNLKEWRLYFSTNPGAGWTAIAVTGASSSYTTSFGSTGPYTLILEARDKSGATGSTTLGIYVNP